MVTLTSKLPLKPEIEKFRFLNDLSLDMNRDYLDEELVDLTRTYNFAKLIPNAKSDLLKKQLLVFFNSHDESLRISANVLAQCYSFIDNLYPSSIEKLDFDDVYSTPNGTIVFDWEKDVDNVFSIEIGADDIGYFVEVNGRDSKQIDSLKFEKSVNEMLQDLATFLSE